MFVQCQICAALGPGSLAGWPSTELEQHYTAATVLRVHPMTHCYTISSAIAVCNSASHKVKTRLALVVTSHKTTSLTSRLVFAPRIANSLFRREHARQRFQFIHPIPSGVSPVKRTPQ